MVETIGAVAGQIWAYLSENGETSVANLKKQLELKGDQAGLGLGWLAREDKLVINQKGNTVKVSLK